MVVQVADSGGGERPTLPMVPNVFVRESAAEKRRIRRRWQREREQSDRRGRREWNVRSYTYSVVTKTYLEHVH